MVMMKRSISVIHVYYHQHRMLLIIAIHTHTIIWMGSDHWTLFIINRKKTWLKWTTPAQIIGQNFEDNLHLGHSYIYNLFVIIIITIFDDNHFFSIAYLLNFQFEIYSMLNGKFIFLGKKMYSAFFLWLFTYMNIDPVDPKFVFHL